MSDLPKLLPCPFCGSTIFLSQFVTNKLVEGFMACYTCRAIGPSAPQPSSTYSDRIVEAAKANRQDEVKDLIEQMNEEWKAEALRLWNQRAQTTAESQVGDDGGKRGEG